MVEESQTDNPKATRCLATIGMVRKSSNQSDIYALYMRLPPGLEDHNHILGLKEEGLAEIVDKYVKQGEDAYLYLIGWPLCLQYENKENIKRYSILPLEECWEYMSRVAENKKHILE